MQLQHSWDAAGARLAGILYSMLRSFVKLLPECRAHTATLSALLIANRLEALATGLAVTGRERHKPTRHHVAHRGAHRCLPGGDGHRQATGGGWQPRAVVPSRGSATHRALRARLLAATGCSRAACGVPWPQWKAASWPPGITAPPPM
jgi:hypothetical protein